MEENNNNVVQEVLTDVTKETLGTESGRSLVNSVSDVAVFAQKAEGPLKTILTWALITAAVVGVAYFSYRGIKYVIKKKKKSGEGSKFEIQEVGTDTNPIEITEEQKQLVEKDAEIERLKAELAAKTNSKK